MEEGGIAPLVIQLRKLPNGLVIDMRGEIGKSTEDLLFHVLQWGEQAPDYLIFNFGQVSYVSSAGISVLLRLIRRCIEEDVMLFGYGIHTLQEKLFKAVGMTDHVSFYPNEYSIMERLKI